MIEQKSNYPEKHKAVTPRLTRKKLKLERPYLGGDSSLDLELPV